MLSDSGSNLCMRTVVMNIENDDTQVTLPQHGVVAPIDYKIFLSPVQVRRSRPCREKNVARI